MCGNWGARVVTNPTHRRCNTYRIGGGRRCVQKTGLLPGIKEQLQKKNLNCGERLSHARCMRHAKWMTKSRPSSIRQSRIFDLCIQNRGMKERPWEWKFQGQSAEFPGVIMIILIPLPTWIWIPAHHDYTESILFCDSFVTRHLNFRSSNAVLITTFSSGPQPVPQNWSG